MIREFDLIAAPLEGSNLIEASAGTGKTFTIAGIYLRLIVESAFKVEEILVVTFTIAATEELRRRIRDKLKLAREAIDGVEVDDEFIKSYISVLENSSVARQRIVNALKSFDEASVYTIHSFCQQVLVDNAFESGSLYNIEIAPDKTPLIWGLVKDFWRIKLYNADELIVRYFLGKIEPLVLLRLYKGKPLDPSARVEPEPREPDIEKMKLMFNDLSSRFGELQKLWPDISMEIRDILLNSGSLKANIYSESIVDKMVNDLNSYLSGNDPMLLPENFGKFTGTRIGLSLKGKSSPPESPFFDFCDRYYNIFQELQELLNDLLIFTEHELFKYIEDKLERIKGEMPGRSFDDLIRDVHHAVTGERGGILASNVSGRYRAALIDEFQDTDQLQFEIFSRLFNNKESVLFLIGDPKQAIYRFRGADIFSYLQASAGMDNKYTLLNNWRSRDELIKAVNLLFSGCENPFNFDRIEFSSVRPGKADQAEIFYDGSINSSGMEIMLAAGGDSGAVNAAEALDIILSNITAKISEIIDPASARYRLGEKALNPGDIAVLVKKHAYARDLRARLRKLGIPSVIQSDETVFSTHEALELYYILHAAAEPGIERSVKGALSTDIMGMRADDIARFSEADETGPGEGLSAIADRFYSYRDMWHSRGVMSMFNSLLYIEQVEERLFSYPDGERRITNIHHLIEMLHRMEKRGNLSANELVIWFKNGIMDGPSDDEYLTRLEKDDFAVKIQTIHSSKGLEFPVVFCPLLPESSSKSGGAITYHDPDEGYRPVMYLGSSSVPERVKELFLGEESAENVRLTYVALTRAKSKCFVYTAKTKKNFESGTPFRLFYKNRNDLENKAPAPDYGQYMDAFKSIAVRSEGSIDFNIIQRAEGAPYSAVTGEGNNLAARVFSGEIRRDWRVWSYSSLVKHDASYDGKDRDASTGLSFSTPLLTASDSIFSFPSGAKAGLFMHEIFENIDFTWGVESISPVIRERSLKYGFEDKWHPHLADMVNGVISSELDSKGLTLSSLGNGERLNELEFYIPVSAPSADELKKLLSSYGGFSEAASEGIRDASSIRGFLKGYIDMVFCCKGKYYIVDWKSNNLGNSIDLYSAGRLEEEMARHNYFLQYHIYTLALHRYLRLRMGESYSYDRHFGGVYYLFVRGMSPKEPGSGIFYHKPDEALVTGLDDFFKSGVE